MWVMALAAVVVGGCGRNPPPANVDAKAFDAATPELQQVWGQATSAAESNDFGAAIAMVRVLSRQDISMPQREALHNALQVYEAKLRDNAKRGDAAAVKAMKELGLSAAAPGK
jgi:hypothetical protein